MMFWSLFVLAILFPFGLHAVLFKRRKKTLTPKMKFEEVIAHLDVSIHTPITITYSLYAMGFLVDSFYDFSVEELLATQIILTLLILNFLSFLISPFPMSLSVLAKIELDKHHVKHASDWLSFRFADSQDWVLRHLERYFYFLRMDVYKAFIQHDNDRDILSYLFWKSRKQKEIDDYMHSTLLKYDPVNYAKKMFILVIILFFAVNYVLIYTGVQSGLLHFSHDMSHWEAPLYFLMETFSTVGYGDITPANPTTRGLTLFLLFDTVLILLIVVNVIQDYTAHSMERIMGPFKSFQIFLREETSELIYWVETGQVEENLLHNHNVFQDYPELHFSIEAYCDRKKRAAQKNGSG